MNFKDFMELYDNWNGTDIIVNDNNLDVIVSGDTSTIMETRTDLFDKEVVAFGFFYEELVVRVK